MGSKGGGGSCPRIVWDERIMGGKKEGGRANKGIEE
jgi:hypothetical protein